MPAVIRVRGAVVDGTLLLLDRALATTVAPGAVLSIPAPLGESGAGDDMISNDVVTFHVDQVYPDGTQPIKVTARVSTSPAIVELLRKSLVEPEPPPAFAALQPRLLSFDIEREVLGTTLEELKQGLTSILVASFRLPAVRTAAGWQYSGERLKPGMEFYLETSTYRVYCQVLTIENPLESYGRT